MFSQVAGPAPKILVHNRATDNILVVQNGVHVDGGYSLHLHPSVNVAPSVEFLILG